MNPERLLHELEVHQVELEMQNDELRVAQAAITESRDRFSELYDLAPVGYVTLDRAGIIKEANLTVATLLGVERSTLLGRPITAYMDERHADLVYCRLREAFTRGTTRGCDLEIHSEDERRADREIAVHMSCRAVTNDRGERTECRVALTDLSDLREAQAGQLASESQNIALLDTASDAIVCCDASGRIESFNRAAERMFGHARDEVIGSRVRSLIASPWRKQLDAYFLDRSRGESDSVRQLNWEAQGVRKDGSLVPLEIGIGQWWCRGQRKFTAILHDLSGRKRAEAELRESELLFRSVFEHSPVGKAILTVEGRLQRANMALARLVEREQAELIGVPFADLIYADDRETAMQAFDRADADHTDGFGLEFRYVAKSGNIIRGHSILAWIRNHAGEIQYGIALVRDVTARRRAEVESARMAVRLGHARKMEALGTLASGVAHDFGNLLMGISGCAQIGLDALEPGSPARLYMEEIKQAADRGAAIPKRLLQFSRKGSADQSVFELNQVVAGAQRMLERLLGEDVELCMRIAANDSRVLSDPSQIEQMLLNLAANARDAMPSGGALVIETRNQTVATTDERLVPPGEYVALSVIDSGLGMSDEVRERIFEPFFTTKEIGHGTGLGLSAVHGIVEQAGGHIRVFSQPNLGTTFEILLPRTDRRVPLTLMEPEWERAEGPQGHGTILLVEDDRAVRLGTRYHLERGGYRVLEAGSGTEAIECGTKFPGTIDLLLTDVVLPRMGGAQVAREFATLKPGCAVLFMSAHPAEWLEREGRLPAGVPLLQKPFGSEALLPRVHEALAGKETALSAADRPAPALGETILVVDDEPAARLAISQHFRELGWGVLESGDGRQALELCRKHPGRITVLLIDYSLPDMRGDALAGEVIKLCPEAALVYMSGHPGLTLEPPGTLLEKPLDLGRISGAVAEVTSRPKPAWPTRRPR